LLSKRHCNEPTVDMLPDKFFVSFTSQFADAQRIHRDWCHICVKFSLPVCNRDSCNIIHSSWSVLPQRVTNGAPFMVPPKEKPECARSRKLGGHMVRPLMPLPLSCIPPIQEDEGENTEMLRRTGIACHLHRSYFMTGVGNSCTMCWYTTLLTVRSVKGTVLKVLCACVNGPQTTSNLRRSLVPSFTSG
jgi:hypothetical protein